jgi:hypothetical protein
VMLSVLATHADAENREIVGCRLRRAGLRRVRRFRGSIELYFPVKVDVMRRAASHKAGVLLFSVSDVLVRL